MKQLLQFASLLLVVLLGAEPALASVECFMRMSGSRCPMAMAPDCPIANGAMLEACLNDCCRRADVQVAAPMAVPGKPKLMGAIAALPMFAGLPVQVAQTEGSAESAAWSPPRYILNRVLRI